jgi:uncharacterized phage-associated protein
MKNAITVGQKFIELAKQDGGNTLTPMQLLKLVYIAHGCMLGKHSTPLIHEPVEAWRYGPVIKPLYDRIKKYRSNPVEKVTNSFGGHISTHDLNSQENQVIQDVYKKYGQKDGIQLSSLTHQPNTPWDIAWKNGYNVISNDLIEHHYKSEICNAE